MGKHTDEYDDDVFSLDDDLVEEQRKQWISYLLMALLAALVIAGALYGSIVLTRMRVQEQKTKTAVTRVTPVGLPGGAVTGDQNAVEINTDYWPSEAFPNVPAIEAIEFDTRVDNGCATVDVPPTTARTFDEYINTLTEKGAKVYTRSSKLTVLDLDDTEIHLVSNNLKTQIELCGEPAYTWTEEGYEAFELPSTGKLVSVKEGTGAGSRILTYRNATVLDALEYASGLTARGWALNGSLEPNGNIFQAVYKKNNLQTTVDYFSSSEDYLVRFDFLG